MGLEKDLPPGEALVVCFRPFIEHLAASSLSPKTIRRHVDNLWLLGGEIIRDLNYNPALRKVAAQKLLRDGLEPTAAHCSTTGRTRSNAPSIRPAANSTASSVNPSAKPQITHKSLGRGEVLGQCRCLIKFDGVPVYGFVWWEMSGALLHAHRCLEKLRWLLSVFGNLNAERSLSHLINRPVYYREVPALVLEYTPQSGSVLLAAEEGHEFPPIRRDLPPTKAAKVDLLTRRSRNQTGPNFESWSPSQTQSEGAWILIARHIPENILPEACRIL